MEFDFHPLAAKDFRKARRYYAQRSQNVTLRFVNAVDVAIGKILAEPYRWPKHDDQFRWVRTRKFPYLLIYEIENHSKLIIIAVAHTSRKPSFWKKRAKKR